MTQAPRPAGSPPSPSPARPGGPLEGSAEAVRLADRIEAGAWADLVSAAPPPMPSALGMKVARIGGATALVAQHLPVSLFNRVIGLGVEQPASEADLDAVVALYRGSGVRQPWVHVGPASEPPALLAWLEARGFHPAERRAWAKMLRGPEPVGEVKCDLTVAPIGPADAMALARVLAEAHAMPMTLAPWIAALVGRPGWHAYGALDQGSVVAGGLLYLENDTAWLGLAGTLPSHRQRRAQGALMVRRIHDAVAAGCTAIATETGEPSGGEVNPSLANMIRCGFRKACSRLNYALVSA